MPLNSQPSASPGNHFWILRSGNGSGSINTKLRRFTTIEATSWLGNGSDAIFYSDFAQYGGGFGISIAGMYEISVTDGSATASACSFGISISPWSGSVNIQSLPAASRLAMTQPNGFAIQTVTRVVKLVPGDLIYSHHDGSCDLTTNAVMFSIRRVGVA